jgi:hypothetical protein
MILVLFHHTRKGGGRATGQPHSSAKTMRRELAQAPHHSSSLFIASHRLSSLFITLTHHLTSSAFITSYPPLITPHHLSSFLIASHHLSSLFITSHHPSLHHLSLHHLIPVQKPCEELAQAPHASHHSSSPSHQPLSPLITHHHLSPLNTSHHFSSPLITSHHLSSPLITSHHLLSPLITSYHLTSSPHHLSLFITPPPFIQLVTFQLTGDFFFFLSLFTILSSSPRYITVGEKNGIL